MSRARIFLILLAFVALVAVPAASAKNFAPGDLRLCSGHRCVAIRNRAALELLSHFYYASSDREPARALAPHRGAAAYELRFDNGYVTGVVATAKLDRFLSYGVNTGRFAPQRWYRVPAAAAAELRRLAGRLRPLRVTPALVARSGGREGCTTQCP
jgi:hypothetical protein